MIIPPDDDKDPNLFITPTASTSSLPHPPSDLTSSDRNTTFGYPFGSDLSLFPSRLSSHDEHLPPYDPHRSDPPIRQTTRRSITQPTISDPLNPQIRDETTRMSSSRSLPLPTQSTIRIHASSSTQSISEKKKKRRFMTFLKRYKWWIIAVVTLVVVGLALLLGLLVGLKVGSGRHQRPPPVAFSPYRDNSRKADTQWSTDGSSNLTWVDDRDGPSLTDGHFTTCHTLLPLNTSDPLLTLSRPYPNSKVLSTTFYFPLNQTNLPYDFFVLSRGLASWGTVEFVGSDAPVAVVQGGNGSTIRVDVVMRYPGPQEANSIVRVCEMAVDGGGKGVGVYSPILSDGKISTAYMLDPTQLPTFEIIIRLPPSALSSSPSPISIPSFMVDVDHMSIRMGNLFTSAQFGVWNVTTRRGGVYVNGLSARSAYLYAAENCVHGSWNVSETLAINVTDGSITADVYLTTPPSTATFNVSPFLDTEDPTDSSSTSSSSLTSSSSSSSSSDLAPSTQSNSTSDRRQLKSNSPRDQSKIIHDPSRRGSFIPIRRSPPYIYNTTFVTDAGSLTISYLSQPPQTGLSALAATGAGDVSLSLSPNYVGPWVVKNAWGDVRLPLPIKGIYDDALGLDRVRKVLYGPVEVQKGSLFDEVGFGDSLGSTGSTSFPGSTLLSGVSFWGIGNETIPSILSGAGRGSQVAVLGQWGDVRISFDGT
ncbi:hypothetical protein M231_07612 [Tremella mesenterica]|uniref:Uncharacterized protein n=1 Tax=Tremella mesenterica TaxID=5217 RepID=A0A4Q1BAT2_TREME|nr:hypothetical protein M231_07612 [Tremella mesenterica]